MIEMIFAFADLQIHEQLYQSEERCVAQRISHRDVEFIRKCWNGIQHRHQQLFIWQHNQCLFRFDALGKFFIQHLRH